MPADASTGAGATSTNELSEDAAEVCKSSRAIGGVADASLDISQASSVGTVVAGDNGPASTLTVAATTDEEQKPMSDDDVFEASSAPDPTARCTAHTAPPTLHHSLRHPLCIARPSRALPPAHASPPPRHPPGSPLLQVLHSAYRSLSGTLHTLLDDGELPGRMLKSTPTSHALAQRVGALSEASWPER